MKMIKKAIIAAAIISGAAQANVYVTGKAPLTLGEDAARVEAIKQALIDASYRKNAYVSSKTEIENLEIKETASIIKTSTVIKDYTVSDEYDCGMFYCVELKVTYGDKPKIEEDIDGSSLFFNIQTNTATGVDNISLFEGLSQKIKTSINGLDGTKIVDSVDLADYKVDLLIGFESAEQGMLSFMLEPKHKVTVWVELSNKVAQVSKTIELENYLNSESESEDLYDGAQQVKSAILALIKQLPSENTFVVSNIEGNKIFIKSTEQTIGSYYQVIFEDLKTGEDVVVPGVVSSVYLDDVIIQLEEVPPSFYRLKRLSKITQ
ncbi:hypothetical protein [Alteromonas macleodii]|uniref:hypothetical protein n=1 Tax=Alteromonas macleodii TaxID=28108 RepID=UPI003140A5C9